MWWSALGHRKERLAYVAAYVAGAEVLWRMTGGSPLWEFGKYATVGVLALAWLQRQRMSLSRQAFAYLLLLLPAVPLTIANLSAWDARVQLSFNLSGPLTLSVCTSFFSNLKLDAGERRVLFLSLIGPLIGVAALSLSGIATNQELAFRTQSNADASGGFGPNQVSAVLGLGVVDDADGPVAPRLQHLVRRLAEDQQLVRRPRRVQDVLPAPRAALRHAHPLHRRLPLAAGDDAAAVRPEAD